MKEVTLREGEFGARYIKAVGGLHYIRGNPLPYFSLTIVSKDFHGAANEELLHHWPELKPLADLHLSNIDGVPMHAEANGWYWLAGALGGLGERFHGGTADSYRTPTPDGCMEIFAKYVRLPINEARGVGVVIQDQFNEHGASAARKAFAIWIEAQKPRWKAEADACIAALNLQVLGDHWAREPVAA